MIILFYLFFLSFSRQCRHQIFPRLGQPTTETYYTDEGEHICINSTGNNYLNVLFYNSLLSVRYFTSPKTNSQSTNNEIKTQNTNINNRLAEAGKFLFPAEKGGVSLPKSDFSSVDIVALVPGNITISALIFPDECTLGRYVSTEFSSELHIADTFGSFSENENNNEETKQQSLCVWYAQNEYTLQASISPSQDDKILVCSSAINCDEPFTRIHQYSEISADKFVKVVPKTKDFWSDLNLIFSTEKPSNLFQITGIMKDEENSVSYKLSMKKIDKDDENEDDVENKNIKPDDNDNDINNNDGDNEEDNADNNKQEVQNKNVLDSFKKNNFRHHSRSRKRNSDSYSNLVIFLSAFVCLFLICCLVAYLFSRNGPCGKHRSLANDHSEERLLPNNQGGFFPGYPMPWGQHPPGQGFFNGVFPFAGVPGQPQPPQQQMQYFTSPGSSFQNVPNTSQQDNQNDENSKNENPPPQQMPFQQPMVYVVPPQYQQPYMQQYPQNLPQYPQNLPQYPQNLPQYPQSTPPQQTNTTQQQNQEDQEHQP